MNFWMKPFGRFTGSSRLTISFTPRRSLTCMQYRRYDLDRKAELGLGDTLLYLLDCWLRGGCLEGFRIASPRH